MGRSKLFHDISSRLVLVTLSLGIAFAMVESISRVFFPDNQVRYIADPEALYRLEPDQVAFMKIEDGSLSRIHINDLGFRGASMDARHSYKQKILILGDSFTFGSGVSDNGTFSAVLDRWMPDDFRIVNGGQPGYGVFQMVATLKRVQDTLHPILVVVVLWQGDFLRQPPDERGREAFFRRARLSKILRTSSFLTYAFRSVQQILIRFGATNLVFHVGEGIIDPGQDSQTVIDTYLRGVEADLPRFLAINQEAQHSGRRLLLVLWPKQDFATTQEGALSERLTERLTTFARQHSISFLSLQTAMRRAASPSLLIPEDWHPSSLAHCLAAQAIAAKLIDLGFGSSRDLHCTSTAPAVNG